MALRNVVYLEMYDIVCFMIYLHSSVDRARIKLATPGSAVRVATDCTCATGLGMYDID